MDVLYHTEDSLEVRSRHWRLVLYMGLAFTFAGLLVFIVFGRTTSLTCTRQNGSNPDCILNQSLFGVTIREKPIDELIYARVVENRDGDGDLTYRIILETESGHVPMTSYYSSGLPKKNEIVKELNDFVKDHTMQTVNVQQGGTYSLIFPMIFTMTGIAEMLASLAGRNNTWHFDKIERVVTHKKLGFTGVKYTQYALDEISGATLASSRDSEGDTTYRIELNTKSGESIPMTIWFTSGYSQKNQTTVLIRDFLNGTN